MPQQYNWKTRCRFWLFGWALMINPGCQCDDDLRTLSPLIRLVEVGQPHIPVCASAPLRDCALSFGRVPIGERVTLTLLLQNPSNIGLEIESVAFAANETPFSITAFNGEGKALSDWPIVLLPSGHAGGFLLQLTFAPVLAGAFQNSFRIVSDADPIQSNPNVVVHVTGTAIATPSYEAPGQRDDPSEDGEGDATNSDSRRPESEPDVENPVPSPAMEPESAPEPTSSPVPTEPPLARADLMNVNGHTPGNVIHPLDDVRLTGHHSEPGAPERPIISYEWELVERPDDSRVVLTHPNEIETGFWFAGGSSDIMYGLDVVGRYRVRLRVTDSAGLESTNEAWVEMNAIPAEELHVQMTWNVGENDIDLHLRREHAPEYCTDDGCFFANCKAEFSSHLEWDGVLGRTLGDPVLDIDDLHGYGPENINIDLPRDDVYRVAVHYFSGEAHTEVNVKIFVHGALQAEYRRDMSEVGDFWEVADIVWEGGGATVQPIENFYENSQCPHVATRPDSPLLCSDTCAFSGDGWCDDGGTNAIYGICMLGTDCSDCGARANPTYASGSSQGSGASPNAICENTCRYANDGECDDGGSGADYSLCQLGSDCGDCGTRNGEASAGGGSGLCHNTCGFAYDGDCDDGGAGSDYSVCALGSDCADCGER